jgi:hypothetical protein
MAAPSSLFLTPLGLIALASLIPLVIVYLLRPDPQQLRIPTLRFISEEGGAEGRSSALKRFQENLLFVLQALVLVLLALSLATPYIQMTGAATQGEVIVVVDTTASMAAGEGQSRFERALNAAEESLSGQTTIITAGVTPRVELRGGSVEDARQTLSTLSVTDAPGNLQEAIARANAIASTGDRIVVLSDFADESDWQAAVDAGQAQGYSMTLRQFDGGGSDNVGIVDLSFSTTEVTVTVQNTGVDPARRQLGFNGEQRTLELEPGDTVTRSFELPAGGGTIRLSPGDSFSVDDTAAVVAPEATNIDVLLLTNGENRFVRTALGVIPGVELTVKRPPTAISAQYDVLVFGAVDPQQVLRGTVQTGQTTLEQGGGVVVQSQTDVERIGLGEMLLVNPGPARNGTTAQVVSDDPLVDGISFPTPSQQIGGQLRRGQALVNTSNGVPLVARAPTRDGLVLHYGYPPGDATFGFAARYPVFWKRAIIELSGRPQPSELNRETGETVRFGTEQVDTPEGTQAGPTVSLTRAGVYQAADRRLSANLLSAEESALETASINRTVGRTSQVEDEGRPLDLTPLTAGLAALLVVVELVYLRSRGDL